METRTHFQSRRFSLIDVSSEDDSLIASSSGNPLASNYSAEQENVELQESITGNKLEDTANSYEYRGRGCQPSKYLELSSTKTTKKYNLRQSLAWDSEFFTSAGVLEPEELSSILESGNKSEKRGSNLRRTPEDVHRSSDSISTLNDSLESLEADLFEDIRASIQKSHNKVPKEKGISKRIPEASQSRIGRASKKMDMADHNKMKLEPTSKNSSNILQVSGRTKKYPSSPELSKRYVAKSKELSLCHLHIKSEKSGSSSISSKRDSLGDLHIEPGKDNPRRITAGGSLNTMPKRTVLTKPSLGSSAATKTRSSTSSSLEGKIGKTDNNSWKRKGSSAATKTRSSTSSSLEGKIGKPENNSWKRKGSSAATKTRSSTSSSLEGKIGKPDNNSWKRKNDSASNIPHSSSSIVKTQLGFDSRNKMQSEKSNVSACLKSVSKLSSYSSPASSTSDRSLESAASTSTVAQKSTTSSTYIDNGSSQKASSDTKTPKFSDSPNLTNKQNMEGKRKQVTDCRSQSVNTASPGLRLPSAKIGFFDGAKHVIRTPRGPLQPHAVIPGGLRKTGGRSMSSTSQQNKEKIAKPHPAGSVMAAKATGGNPQPSGTVKQKSPTRRAKAVAKASLSSEDLISGEMDIQNGSSLCTVAGTSNSESSVDVGHNNDMLDPDSAKGKDVIDPSVHKIHSKDKEGASNGEGGDTQKTESASCICMTTESTSPGNDLLINQPELPIDRLRGRFEAWGGKSSPGGLIDQNHQGSPVGRLKSKFEVSAMNTEIKKEAFDKSQSLSKMPLRDHADDQDSPMDLLHCPRKDNSLNSSDENTISPVPATAAVPTCRRPFAAKDSLCNVEGTCNKGSETSATEAKRNLILEEKNKADI